MRNTMTAPVIDRLLFQFDTGFVNARPYSKDVMDAMEPLFSIMADLAPLPKNDEVKMIWLKIPRGTLEDFGDFQQILDDGEVKSREEFEELWHEEYPDEYKWYQLFLVESFNKDGSLRYRGVSVGRNTIVSASFEEDTCSARWEDESIICLCSLLAEAAAVSMDLLRNGTYGCVIDEGLPYWFRKGVVKRTDVMAVEPEMKDSLFEGLSQSVYERFCELVTTGQNDVSLLRPMKTMTANVFFCACSLGYKACNYKGTDKPLADQYLMHADGRDEGLTGRGSGLHREYGSIDFDSPEEWDKWYHKREHWGGHPWEVCRGGNSTHVDLFVHDSRDISFALAMGRMTEEKAKKARETGGYYFSVAGKAWSRAAEAVNFYVAIHDVGFPIVLEDADEILARFRGEDWIGIVPHDVIPNYCESMFPEEYGCILDFMHVYKEENAWFKNIQWLPVERAKLKSKM